MSPSFELLLALGVVGFYLVDSAMLLYANELVYQHSTGRWRFAIAPGHMQLLGKYLYLPNLLTPERAVLRLRWSTSARQGEPAASAESVQRFLAAVDSLRYAMGALWALLVVGVPVSLLLYGTNITFLLILALAYAAIVVLLVQIYRKREALGVSGRSFAKLAFDGLACAPLALNLVRKITLHFPLGDDPIVFAQTRFDKTAFADLVEQLRQWINAELEYEDKESPRYRALSDYQQSLARMVS